MQNIGFDWADGSRARLNDLLGGAGSELLLPAFGRLRPTQAARLAAGAPLCCVQVCATVEPADAVEAVGDPQSSSRRAAPRLRPRGDTSGPPRLGAAAAGRPRRSDGSKVDCRRVAAVQAALGFADAAGRFAGRFPPPARRGSSAAAAPMADSGAGPSNPGLPARCADTDREVRT